MELKLKLRELRLARDLTQENVAEQLGISSQTVSKWERGLLSPDITLLPKIALLYRCSIDTLFDMNTVWGEEHRKEFEEKIRLLGGENDWEGVYKAWIHEIELHPDQFSDYPQVMLHVFRKNLLTDDHIHQMLCLAHYAERNCVDDTIRNEIYRIMLQICAKSDTPPIKEKTQYYYEKLPLLKHSREVYCQCALEGEEYHCQVKQNIFYSIDMCECAVRQLVSDDMPPTEQLYYYQKAAGLYELVLDGKFGGLYDAILIWDYNKIAGLLMEMGEEEQAEAYIERILSTMEHQLSEEEKKKTSVFLYNPTASNLFRLEKNCEWMLHAMLQNEKYVKFWDRIAEFSKRYFSYLENKQKFGSIHPLAGE